MPNHEGETKRVKAKPGKKRGRVKKDSALEAGKNADEAATPKGKEARTAGGTPIIQKEVT